MRCVKKNATETNYDQMSFKLGQRKAPNSILLGSMGDPCGRRKHLCHVWKSWHIRCKRVALVLFTPAVRCFNLQMQKLPVRRIQSRDVEKIIHTVVSWVILHAPSTSIFSSGISIVIWSAVDSFHDPLNILWKYADYDKKKRVSSSKGPFKITQYSTVEPWHNKRLRDWQVIFTITRFRYNYQGSFPYTVTVKFQK